MAKVFPDIEAFYDDRPERRLSGEADYGVHWRHGNARWPAWRVSYIQATGEVYAVQLRGNPIGPVRLLGVVPPDPEPGRYYRTLDRIMDGWAAITRPIRWAEQKLREAPEAAPAGAR